ncbi:MAG: M28 family peptidase [Bacteriovoracaceae bacterium]
MKKLILFLLIVVFSNLNADMVSDVQVLSNENLAGRGLGMAGNSLAVDYLLNESQKLGVTTFKQEFTVFVRMEKIGFNKIELTAPLEVTIPTSILSPEFEPVAFSKTAAIFQKQLVFAGYGITLPKGPDFFNYDDYEFLNVKDKIVIIFANDPAINNPHSPFRDVKYLNYRSINFKLQNALKHEAAGVLIVQDPLSLTNQNPEEEAPLFFNEAQGGGNNLEIVSGLVTNRWVNYLLDNFSDFKNSTLELQKTINALQKPLSFVFNQITLNMQVNLIKKTGRVANVVAYIPGIDPILKNDVIVLGAHLDHLGLGGNSSMETDHSPKIHFGADDNASGCALILDLLKRLKQTEHNNSYMIVFFNGEESGLLGSNYFVQNWNSDLYGKIKFMLNFDMVGRFQKELSIIGTSSAFEWELTLDEVIRKTPTLPYLFQKSSIGSSDHASFLNKKIPILFFTTGAHSDYHRSSDTFDKINFPAMEKLSDFTYNFLRLIETEHRVITYNPDVINGDDGGTHQRGYGSYFGCVPQFGETSNEEGVVCTQTLPASPSFKAGIQAGDRIIQMGEIPIKTIYDLSFVLKYYRPGDTIRVRYLRNGAPFETMVLLANRSS